MGALYTYDAIRPKLVSGHVITYDGSNLLSRAIKFFAKGGSHTAMVLRISDCPDTVFCIEALEDGPVLTRLSKQISNYNGIVHIQMPTITEQQQAAITAMSLRLIGSRIGYDYPSLFANIRKRVVLNMKRGFCSETAQYILTMVGVLPPQLDAMTPGELREALGHEVTLAPYTAACESVTVGGM